MRADGEIGEKLISPGDNFCIFMGTGFRALDAISLYTQVSIGKFLRQFC